jgi:hypothetical protein
MTPLRPTPLSSYAKRAYRATVIQNSAGNHVSTLEKSSSSRCLIKLFLWIEFRRMGYRQLVIRDDFETVPHQEGRTTGDQARTTTSHHNSPNTITHTQYFYWIRLLNPLVDPSWTLLPSSSACRSICQNGPIERISSHFPAEDIHSPEYFGSPPKSVWLVQRLASCSSFWSRPRLT